MAFPPSQTQWLLQFFFTLQMSDVKRTFAFSRETSMQTFSVFCPLRRPCFFFLSADRSCITRKFFRDRGKTTAVLAQVDRPQCASSCRVGLHVTARDSMARCARRARLGAPQNSDTFSQINTNSIGVLKRKRNKIKSTEE